MNNQDKRFAKMTFAPLYPHYVEKAEKDDSRVASDDGMAYRF
ncbi:MAG: hypothetical protein ACI9DJ_002715 [Algoriphagus sp.]|jgi:hypothetical protein